MSPFREHPEPVHSVRRCFSFRRCLVCAKPSAQLRQEFFALVHGSWSTQEVAILSKAARSALL